MHRSLITGFFLFACLVFGACVPEHVVSREVLSVTSGGPGEAWVVLHEVEGEVGSTDADTNQYVIHHCVTAGCKPISAIKGSEKRRVSRRGGR